MITAEQFNDVLDLVKTTTDNFNKICKTVGISSHGFYEYVNSSEEHELKYAQARARQLEHLSDQIQELDQQCIDLTLDKSIDPKSKNAMVQAYRLKIDNLKWLLSKLMPKKYGDKIDVTSNGESIVSDTLSAARKRAQSSNNSTQISTPQS